MTLHTQQLRMPHTYRSTVCRRIILLTTPTGYLSSIRFIPFPLSPSIRLFADNIRRHLTLIQLPSGSDPGAHCSGVLPPVSSPESVSPCDSQWSRTNKSPFTGSLYILLKAHGAAAFSFRYQLTYIKTKSRYIFKYTNLITEHILLPPVYCISTDAERNSIHTANN